MADDKLKDPVVLRALGINAASLPPGFPMAYQRYVLDQAQDLNNVAEKANEAGKGAYDGQQKNDEQDAELATHESRLDDAEATLGNHEFRITTAENNITSLDTRLTTAENDIDFITDEIVDIETRLDGIDTEIADHESRLTQTETDISDIQADYVSKSATAPQELLSPLGIATSFSIDGIKVLGPQQTGWTAGSGTPSLGAFNADLSFTVGAAYSQSEVQEIATALVEARSRILALEQAMRTHGLID
ncbi:phage tail protein [Atlantibacter hermannii]|uniref:phage tail protein n=1 Tax=Atlantibacter hermannii TaxID=565 RepID=UPI002FDDAA38